MSDRPFADPAGTWNQRYTKAGHLFGTAPNNYLASRAELIVKGGRVLAVADGNGRNSVWLAKQGFAVDAFDVSEVGVAKAREFAAESGVTVNYAVANGDALDWPAYVYDAVVAIFIQFAPPEMRARLFANMVRCLKPDGLLILQGYTPKQLDYRTGGPPEIAHLYTPALLREAFGKTTEIIELTEYEDVLDEGTGHSGQSALIGLVARRR